MSSVHSSSPREIISATLGKYSELTHKDLVNDPLAAKIRSCYDPGPPESSDTIYNVLQQRVQTFNNHSKLETSLKSIVDNLQGLSTNPALQVNEPSPPVPLVFSSIDILLAVRIFPATLNWLTHVRHPGGKE